jgi:integrase
MVLSRIFKKAGKSSWYYCRRVPLQFQHLDPRGIIRQTTGIRIGADPYGAAARKVAEGMDAALETYWANLAAGGDAKALAEYQAACQAAVKLGVSPPMPQQAMRTIEELLDRIDRLERGKVSDDKASVAALLDVAPLPKLTFRDCAEQYIAAHKSGWKNAKHAKQWPSTLQQYVYPLIGDLPVAQLSGRTGTEKIKTVLDPIWHTKTETASRVRGRIEKVLDWAKVQGFRDGENPARWTGHLDALYPSKEKVAPVDHMRAMPYRDVPEFMDRLHEQQGIGARALELTILTAARVGEVLLAKRSEFDRKSRMWVIPKGRMKRSREHRVPICDSVLKIIDALPKGSEYLIPGQNAGQPLDGKALRRVMDALGANEFDVHGFRSSFRDWGGEVTDYPGELLELALSHSVGDKVEQAYRRGDMLAKRHALMRDWERFCNGSHQ